MTFANAFVLTGHLTAFTLFLQAVEILAMLKTTGAARVWSYENLRGDLEAGLPLPRSWIGFLFADRIFIPLAAVQALVAFVGVLFPSAPVFAALIVTHFLLCLRFRGSLNGGSDMMTFIVLTGTLLASALPGENLARLGLVYIAVNLMYSYFKAGVSKLGERGWRTGSALPVFLGRSFFNDVRAAGVVLARRPVLLFVLSWGVLAFELAAILLPFAGRGLGIYFAAAMIFHALNHRIFGLNRFFWAWLCAWPSVFYVSTLL